MVENSTMTNATNNTNIPSIERLEYQQFLEEDIPTICFLAILSIVGTIGNIHTLLVYSLSKTFAKVAFRNFMLWLSAVDLIACAISMPFEMIEIRFNYTFSSVFACKFFRFVAYIVSIASSGMLGAIAVERYTINAKRLPKVNAKPSFVINTASALIIAISVLLSIPALVLYGLEAKETGFDGVIGSDCMILLKYKTMATAGIYSGFVLLLSTISCVICCYAYGKILNIIFKHRQNQRIQMRLDSNQTNSSSITQSSNQLKGSSTSEQSKSSSDQTKSSDISSPEAVEMLNLQETGEMSPNTDPRQLNARGPIKTDRGHKFVKGIRLTVSLIVATCVSYLGYIIFVATILITFAVPSVVNNIRPVSELLARLNFLTNAINPVVYCLIDNKFRAECLNLYRKTTCCPKLSNG